MKSLIVRILLSSSGFYLVALLSFAFHVQWEHFRLLTDVALLAISVMLTMSLVFWDWNKGRKLTEMITDNKFLFMFGVFMNISLALIMRIESGLLTLFMLFSLGPTQACALLDRYNGYTMRNIIKRMFLGIIVIVVLMFVALITVHSGDGGRVFAFLAPVISAIFSHMSFRKDENADLPAD